MLELVKFFHILGGTVFFGISIASFYYIARSISKGDRALIAYSIKTSYFGDGVILACIAIQMASSFPLRAAAHFTLDMPWIFIAYMAFGVLIALWLLNILVKSVYLSALSIAPFTIKLFYALNSTMVFILILITHDAVMKNTVFAFLWEK
jgi:uncharacterized membrane protein